MCQMYYKGVMKRITTALIALIATATPLSAQTVDLSLAEQINAKVNSEIKFKDDSKRDPTFDSWDIPTKYGDCEDYALLKRKMLIEAGFDPADVKIIIVVRSVDKQTTVDGKRVVAAHVVVKIESLGIVLDSPPRQSTYSGYNSTPVVTYADWMKKTESSFFCNVVNFTEGNSIATLKRCEIKRASAN